MIETRQAVDMVQGKLVLWLESLVRMLPNLILAALTVVLFWILARVLRHLSNKILLRIFQMGTLQRLAVTLIHFTTVLIGLFAALSILHLDKTVTSLLAGAGILGLALGFAFQDIASNFISGILIATNRPFRVGELIQSRDNIGVVQRIDLRTTELRSLQGIHVLIPNKEIFQNVFHNYTRNGVRRVDLEVPIGFRDDLEHVNRTATTAVRSVPDVLQEYDVDMFYQRFEDHYLVLEARFWILATSNRHYHKVKSDVIMALKAAFDREGVILPYPVRLVEMGEGVEKVPSGT
jgi:small conductance mechanosensitive channel